MAWDHISRTFRPRMSSAEILPAPVVDTRGVLPTKWDREKAAFRALLPSLLDDHRGRYVAIHEGVVVASGDDQLRTAREAYAKFGYVPIYVGLVTDQPPPQLRVPTPRLVRLPRGGGEER